MTMTIALPLRLLCTAALASFATTGAFADGFPRPFKASFSTQEVLGYNMVSCPAPPFLQGKTHGIGTASILGAAELDSTDCIFPISATTFIFTNGKLILKAEVGSKDTVTADYSGLLLPVFGSTTATLSGGYRVTGGTGSFHKATGAGFLTGTIDHSTNSGSFEASGIIAY